MKEKSKLSIPAILALVILVVFNRTNAQNKPNVVDWKKIVPFDK